MKLHRFVLLLQSDAVNLRSSTKTTATFKTNLRVLPPQWYGRLRSVRFLITQAEHTSIKYIYMEFGRFLRIKKKKAVSYESTEFGMVDSQTAF